jgi:hypothetical protein
MVFFILQKETCQRSIPLNISIKKEEKENIKGGHRSNPQNTNLTKSNKIR